MARGKPGGGLIPPPLAEIGLIKVICIFIQEQIFNPISTLFFFGRCSTEGGGGGFTPSITPLSLKLDHSIFLQNYFNWDKMNILLQRKSRSNR